MANIININKINKFLLASIVILLVALVGIIYWQQSDSKKTYWAVYLNTGDFYFGQMSSFPRLSLKNAYLLQRNVNDQQNPFSISKFSNAFWGPEDKIYINDDSIIWKAKLKNDSQIVNFINNQQSGLPAIQNQAAQPSTGMIPPQPQSAPVKNQ